VRGERGEEGGRGEGERERQRHRERERYRDTETQRERQRERETEGKRDRDRERETETEREICFVVAVLFESGFLCVALAVQELALETRLALKSEIHLPLPPACWS